MTEAACNTCGVQQYVSSAWRRRIGNVVWWSLPVAAVLVGWGLMRTQQRYTEASRRMHLYYNVLKHSNEAIVITDAVGVIEDWNDGAVKLFGVSPDDAIGAPATFVIPEDMRERHVQAMRKPETVARMLAGEISVTRCWALGRDGPVYVVIRTQAVQNSAVHFVAQINREQDIKTQTSDMVRPPESRPRNPKQEPRP